MIKYDVSISSILARAFLTISDAEVFKGGHWDLSV